MHSHIKVGDMISYIGFKPAFTENRRAWPAMLAIHAECGPGFVARTAWKWGVSWQFPRKCDPPPIPLKVAKNSLTLDEKQQSLTKPIQLTITKHSPTSAGAIRLETEPQSWSSCSSQNWGDGGAHGGRVCGAMCG